MRSLRLLLFVTLFALTACSDDEETITPVVSFTQPALYITEPSTSATVGYGAYETVSLNITAVPEGWTATVNPYAGVVTVTSPADFASEETDRSGTVSLTAYSPTGQAATATLYVSCDTPEALDANRSNCYVVTRGSRSYSFPVDKMGESDRTLSVASVGMVWQSPSKTILYPQMEGNGRLSFYVPEENGAPVPGNALLAAYDKNGEVVWTWHVWVTATEPQDAGGWMDRNLGAELAAHASQTDILRSYGTYYQWGRMTPFVGPYAYNCASSADAYMYYGSSTTKRLYIAYEEATAETGTVQYAVSHPLVYLLGSEANGYDWNRSHDNTLWTADTKSLYDPCPKGWRVAKSFDGWRIGDDLAAGVAAWQEQFGWNLTNGSEQLFFLGGGRRSWLNGLITNVNTNEIPKPWIGYYWTAEARPDNRSTALYFNLDTEDAVRSEFDPQLSARRAEGMQVRCVKE